MEKPREYTGGELMAVIEQAVDIGRKLERCALLGVLEALVLRAAAAAAKANDEEALVHSIAGATYRGLRQRFNLNRGMYETGHTLAPVLDEAEEAEQTQRLVTAAMTALKQAGESLGMGPLVEVACGCCGTKILCSEEHPVDRCPRCIEHRAPDKEAH